MDTPTRKGKQYYWVYETDTMPDGTKFGFYHQLTKAELDQLREKGNDPRSTPSPKLDNTTALV